MKLRVTLACLATVLLLGSLSACGGDQSPSAAGPAGQAPVANGAPAGRPGGAMPGTSGTIAAVTGKTLQVQSAASGQVAVTYTAQTAVTQQVDASLDDVSVGVCVMVTPDDTSTDPSGAAGEQQAMTASSVRITDPVEGACQGPGQGGPGGERPSGQPADPRSGGTGARPPGMMMGVNGQVTEVSDGGFTVEAVRPVPGSDTPQSATITVTVSGSTTYTTTAEASADALAVGRCVTATGEADDTGAVSATRIAVSDPVDGSCTTGFPGRPGGAA